MKKKTCFIVVLLLSVCLTYAQNNFEGFDGFPWNTTVSEFLKKFPEAKDSTDSDDKERNERVFQRSSSTVIRVYRFYGDKLYWGRTVYQDPDLETEKAILEKIVDTYGKFDDSNTWTEDGNEYLSVWKTISPTFDIEFTEVKYYNSYGRVTGLNVFITYENAKTRKEADEYYKNSKKKNIEL